MQSWNQLEGQGKGAISMIIEIACVESVIENEIKQGCTQRQIAQTYALALRSSWPTDWLKVNNLILAKWPKGLERVKNMAWSGKCFEAAK